MIQKLNFNLPPWNNMSSIKIIIIREKLISVFNFLLPLLEEIKIIPSIWLLIIYNALTDSFLFYKDVDTATEYVENDDQHMQAHLTGDDLLIMMSSSDGKDIFFSYQKSF